MNGKIDSRDWKKEESHNQEGNCLWFLHSSKPTHSYGKIYFKTHSVFSIVDFLSEERKQVDQVPWYDDKISDKTDEVTKIHRTRRQIVWKKYWIGRSSPDRETFCLRKVLRFLFLRSPQLSIEATSIKRRKTKFCGVTVV